MSTVSQCIIGNDCITHKASGILGKAYHSGKRHMEITENPPYSVNKGNKKHLAGMAEVELIGCPHHFSIHFASLGFEGTVQNECNLALALIAAAV